MSRTTAAVASGGPAGPTGASPRPVRALTWWHAADRAVRRRPVLVEAITVGLVLVLLQIVVFHGYYSGASVPPWDFTSHYTTEAYAWWHDGSFFRPPEWLPYLWGGYPGVVDLQNSSWYLPVGIASAVTTYDLQTAAVLSALHVALGALGAYALCRVWRLRPGAALLAMVGWHFAAGFYSNASHLDIMRGYGWLPWILLCASPRWPWRRWWGPALATLVLWQAILAMYPGVLIAAVYACGVWVLVHQLTSRPRLRDYCLPLAASLTLAVALALLRFLPAVLARGSGVPGGGDTSILTWQLLGTFLYPYGDPTLPNDITMRPFFLPASILAALALVTVRSALGRAAAATGLVAVAMGVPGLPWARLVAVLPGMDVSRFRISDFRPFLLLAVCILGAVAVDALLAQRLPDPDGGQRPLRLTPVRAVLLVGGVAGAALVGARGPFPTAGWVAQWALLAVAAGLLALTATVSRIAVRRSAVAGLVVVAAASGLLWTRATPTPWSVPRADTEADAFGAPLDDIVTGRQDRGETVRRPAREESIQHFETFGVFNSYGGRAFYSGELRLTGYVNLKGTPTFDVIRAQIENLETRVDAMTYWMAPGIAIATTDGRTPDAATTLACLDGDRCGLVTSEPVLYSDRPELVYRLSASRPEEVSFNEAYYPGWKVSACAEAEPDRCLALATARGAGGQLLVPELPAGTWIVRATYDLPGMAAAWAAFWAGATAVVAWSVVIGLSRRRRAPA